MSAHKGFYKMRKLATPVSHLFKESSEQATQIMEKSDVLECRDRSYTYSEGKQDLFHSDLQPVHEFTDKIWNYFEKVAELKKEVKLVTFHVASSCDAPVLEGKMWQPGGKSYTPEEMVENAKNNFKRFRELFGENVEFALENNNYYPSDAYKYVCEPKFIKDLIEELDINFLYDIAHSKISAHNMKMSFDKYFNELPIDRMIQVHICEHSFDETGMAYDAHEFPTDNEFEFLKELKQLPHLKYFTVEYYKNMEKLLSSLDKVREIVA